MFLRILRHHSSQLLNSLEPRKFTLQGYIFNSAKLLELVMVVHNLSTEIEPKNI